MAGSIGNQSNNVISIPGKVIKIVSTDVDHLSGLPKNHIITGFKNGVGKESFLHKSGHFQISHVLDDLIHQRGYFP